MSELTQRFGFDLSDPLSRYLELLADFLERSRSAVVQTESEPEHLLLARRQSAEHVHELFLEQHKRRRLGRRGHVVVLDGYPPPRL